ncbi:MAG: J domain-containing protein [Nitrospinae bacterium]|nr:J domain-containing protein [Nitrospinota bacterium]
MKDYYSILEIGRDAGEDGIKKSYRRLAMQYHPDRNPNDPKAEEKFKEITEAYGVLMDPVKRREYDTFFSHAKERRGHEGTQFRYSEEEIFRDLFNDPNLFNFFNELGKEFEKSGVRFGPSLFESVFFRKGGIFFAGAVFSPLNKAYKLYNFFKMAQTAHSAFKKYQDSKGDSPGGLKEEKSTKPGFIKEKIKGLFGKKEAAQGAEGDPVFRLRISPREAAEGTEKSMAFKINGQEERLKVKIPMGAGNGTKLRLKGKGARTSDGRGDLYILIEVG